MQPGATTMKHLWLGASAALLASLCGCADTEQATARAPHIEVPSQGVRAWVTTADSNRQLAPVDVVFNDAPSAPATVDNGAAPAIIEIDAPRRYQQMVGFGAAITDASAWLLRMRMNSAQRTALMKELFGPPPGLQVSFVRLTIGASDFSQTHYSLDD